MKTNPQKLAEKQQKCRPIRYCTGGCSNNAFHHAHYYEVDPVDGLLGSEYLCPGNLGEAVEYLNDDGIGTLEGAILNPKQDNRQSNAWSLHDWPGATQWCGACPFCHRVYSGTEESTHCYTCETEGRMRDTQA